MMKLTLKTLQRDTFEIEIEEDKTVADLKKKVEETKGEGYVAANLKLIYAGKILSDEKSLKEYDISAFIVVMVSKPKPAPASESTAGGSSTPTTPATQAAPTPPTTTAAPPAAAPPAAAPPAAASPAVAPTGGDSNSMFVSGSEYESAVTEMVNMGFERSQIERAMNASFNNPHRAIEYLFNPSTMPAAAPAPAAEDNTAAQPPAAQTPAAQTPAAQTPATQATTPTTQPTTPVIGAGNLEFLRNMPQLQMLRQMVAQDPQMLQNVLEELGQANPQLLQAIQANPQQFINLLNETGGGGGAAPQGAPQGGAAPPPSGGIQITPAEKEAIDRIKALGFPEHLVVQAYFACEKNENLAAEFLFSENFQDDNS